MLKNKKLQSGFTIIELLVATTIFSIVLVVIVASFLQVGRMFYKGVSVNNTNDAARNLMDEIANDARLSTTSGYNPGNTITAPAAVKKFFCIGPHRYTYILNTQVKDSGTAVNANTMVSGIVQDYTGGNCQDPSTYLGTSPRQVLGPDMRLNALDVNVNASGTVVYLHSHVLFYGADSNVFISPANAALTPAQAINQADAVCSGNLLSTQFCAVADLRTNVTLRY